MNSAFHPLHPRPGSAGKPMPGMDVHVVNDNGEEVETGELGNIVLKPVSACLSQNFNSYVSNLKATWSFGTIRSMEK